MHRIRAILKRCIAYGLYYTGALWIYRAMALRNRATVLMYHRVLPDTADSFSAAGIVVSPDVFAANMEFLRKHFAPLSANEFEKCLDQGQFPPGACLVTFDDGWQDNEKHALPILQRFDVPAVLFIATGYVGTRNTFWQERLTRDLFTLSRDPGLGRSTLIEIGVADAFDSGDVECVRNEVRRFVDRLKSSATAEIDRVAAAVSTACRAIGMVEHEVGDDTFLDWDTLQRMASNELLTIGSHAHSHIPLPRLGPQAAMADLQQSIREFARHGLPAPSTFAFPNGDYDAATLGCVRDAGLTTAFTTERGYVQPDTDPRRLPRINIHGSAAATPPEFLCRILGVF